MANTARFKHMRNSLILGILIVLTFASCTTSTPTLAPLQETDTPPPAPTEAPIEMTDGLGRVIVLEETAQRVISMAPSNTEILFAIGAGPQVVGHDSFSDYPAEAQSITDIGGGFGELNSEVIVSLEPDLILVANITPPEQIQTLEDLGLTVFAVPNPSDFEGLYSNLETIAVLTGHEEETETLISHLRSRVSAVQEKIAVLSDHPLVFYELDVTDPNAPYTSGPGTFIDMLITRAGGENLGSTLKGSWVQISIEELISRDPDIIILGDYTWGGVTPDDVLVRAGWNTLTAVKEGKVFIFDDNLVSRPGPRLVDGLEAMAKLLHPDLFE